MINFLVIKHNFSFLSLLYITQNMIYQADLESTKFYYEVFFDKNLIFLIIKLTNFIFSLIFFLTSSSS